ncbi:MAG: protein-L-isoaspartate O-methyltransferase [Nocardioidaceae bacterium]
MTMTTPDPANHSRDVYDRVQAAFAAVPRQPFLPRRERRRAREDRPLDIGYGQTNSQPRTVRSMLELLDPRPGDHVLDVGCGSGWTTALLAHLVGPRGAVVAVEIVPELAETARGNLADFSDRVRVRTAHRDVLGAPDLAPFDRILVSAVARALPDPLVEQLTAGGRLVVPVRGVMLVVDRVGSDPSDVVVDRVGRYAFVPLLWDPPGAPSAGDS